VWGAFPQPCSATTKPQGTSDADAVCKAVREDEQMLDAGFIERIEQQSQRRTCTENIAGVSSQSLYADPFNGVLQSGSVCGLGEECRH
jgi:hypothetical protein